MADENERGLENGEGWLSEMRRMVAALGAAEESGDQSEIDDARDEIQQSSLSVRVRDDWHSPGEAHDAVGRPVEYQILLSTGGPALRIIGNLDGAQPDDSPRLQWQDWFKPWADIPLSDADREAVTRFAAQFYYGEG